MGCTLGASAKIYAHRVDKVYTDMVKIVAGKDIEFEKEDSDGEGNILNGVNDPDIENPKQRKRKCSIDSDDEEKDLNLKTMDFDKV